MKSYEEVDLSIRSKKQQAYDYIRENIQTGRYPGQFRLREEHLAKELKVSRGPLREAISELVSEGLLEKVPGLGVYVRQSGKGELNELYEIREALESFAAGKAAQNISTTDLIDLDRICTDMHEIARAFQKSPTERTAHAERERWLHLDLCFHERIIHLAKNSRLEKLLQDSRVMSQTFREKQADPSISDAPAYLSNLAWAWRDHVRILRALQKRSAKASHRSMVLHITRARHRILNVYEKMNSADQ